MSNPAMPDCGVNQTGDSFDLKIAVDSPHLPINLVSRHAQFRSNHFDLVPVRNAQKNVLGHRGKLEIASIVSERARTTIPPCHKPTDTQQLKAWPILPRQATG